MKRFTNAFHSIFPTKRYIKIENKDGHKEIIFSEYGKQMPIEKLSSGEKQIVFRGGFLLKNKISTQGAVILIDEPEISLHPEWQLKIIPFLKSLFTNEKQQQTSQIIVATHSPFIIHNSNRYNDKVIILKKDHKGNVIISDKPSFYGWNKEIIIQEAFNITNIIDTNKITVFLEGETDEQYLNKALALFYPQHEEIIFEWIGRRISKDKTENTGDKALNNARNLFLANPSLLKNEIVLLYDCDTNKPDENYSKLFVRSMTQNPLNTLYKKGSENLLILPADFDPQPFYSKTTKSDDYGAESIIQNFDKMKLCNHLCNLPEKTLMSYFANFKTEIDKIIAIKIK